ncbi:hypothetical protein HPB52_021953 [Rhipicephalus sanguineus]|uniref:Tick transposon n=1 Tax=Rhipicephalus sanguineus TaxID=34632 RepID=A0A9D4T372_RHISA|nr:hypothetical protein HPB52_021953 [Rhipicephalus sanguineus]
MRQLTALQTTTPAHHPSTAVTDFVCTADVGRLLVARYVRERHPDPRVAAGKLPRRLPLRGLSRADRGTLLRLRIGCHRAAERMHRLSGRGSPYCVDCGDMETLEHLLLRCPAFDADRAALLDVYGRLGLPRCTTSELLFPECRREHIKRALSALLDLITGTALRARLGGVVQPARIGADGRPHPIEHVLELQEDRDLTASESD